MAKTSKVNLFAYAICESIKQKYQNLLDSFYHKDEGSIIKSYDEAEGTITLSDDKTLNLGSEPQFIDTTADKLRALVYVSATVSLSRDKAFFEKGVNTDVKFTWATTANQDTITGVTFDGNLVANNGNETFTITSGVTKTLVLSRATGVDITKTATSTDYVPQYRGELSSQEPNDYEYATLASLTKTISSSTTQNYAATVTGKYVAFLSNKSNAVLKDNDTGFTLSVGDFTSTTAFFLKKTVTVKLSDNTTEEMTWYVTRQLQNANVNVRTE